MQSPFETCKVGQAALFPLFPVPGAKPQIWNPKCFWQFALLFYLVAGGFWEEIELGVCIRGRQNQLAGVQCQLPRKEDSEHMQRAFTTFAAFLVSFCCPALPCQLGPNPLSLAPDAKGEDGSLISALHR